VHGEVPRQVRALEHAPHGPRRPRDHGLHDLVRRLVRQARTAHALALVERLALAERLGPQASAQLAENAQRAARSGRSPGPRLTSWTRAELLVDADLARGQASTGLLPLVSPNLLVRRNG
jgi:hypothetical protein